MKQSPLIVSHEQLRNGDSDMATAVSASPTCLSNRVREVFSFVLNGGFDPNKPNPAVTAVSEHGFDAVAYIGETESYEVFQYARDRWGDKDR